MVGEMGVIEGRSRSATARAVTDGEAEVLTARQFLERVSSDPALARDLILRLSIEAEEDRGQKLRETCCSSRMTVPQTGG